MRLIINHNQYAVVFLAALILSGCSTFTPQKMYDGGIKSKKDVATIIGQSYKEAWWTPPIKVAATKVDGKRVFNGWTTIAIPYVIQVDPGTHDLTIEGGYGNRFHLTPPILQVFVEAGQVYQIDPRFTATAASYSLRHIGNITEYENYLAKHSEYEAGSPLPTLRRTRGASYSPEPLNLPRELFLDYKSSSSKQR